MAIPALLILPVQELAGFVVRHLTQKYVKGGSIRIEKFNIHVSSKNSVKKTVTVSIEFQF